MTGNDEMRVTGTDLLNALNLLDHLLIEGTQLQPGQARQLTATDRDAIFAALYIDTYGEIIQSTLQCRGCGNLFDLSFSVRELKESLKSDSTGNTLKTPFGFEIRLPTGEDELAVMTLPKEIAHQTLLERCMPSVDIASLTEAELETIDQLLETLAPLISASLSAKCPECHLEQLLHFDIQAHLLRRIQNEQARVVAEVHTLELTYHWGLNEILTLSRKQRRQYIGLIETDASRASQRNIRTRRRIS
jgi:hypothetical protein